MNLKAKNYDLEKYKGMKPWLCLKPIGEIKIDV